MTEPPTELRGPSILKALLAGAAVLGLAFLILIVVGQKSKNPQLREWHTKNLERLPGLKFMRTLWVCDVSGGPLKFTATRPGATPLGLEEAHRNLKISPAEFDEVAAELGRSLDFAKVPKREKAEVLAAFAAHKDEVTAGSATVGKRG